MITSRFNLNQDSYVVEIAANDGYLLQNFVAAHIPCLGIEPTADTASAARAKNIPIVQAFFNANMAQEMANKGQQADLIVANNVFAHVPDINDFSLGLHKLLKANGVITLEFPHLLSLLEQVQFDTIYHEHFSYFSLFAVKQILAKVDLRIFDVETLNTHGGSLRVYACHLDSAHQTSARVQQLIDQEAAHRLFQRDGYQNFQSKVDKIKNDLVRFLIEKKEQGKTVVAYGAAAKGNTLLNYAGIKPDLLPVVFDAAKSKQGKFLPGSHIPILSPNHIEQYSPETILILPWNIVCEIAESITKRYKNCNFTIAIPSLKSYE
nr:class I SAM-dependent methyltransferase [Motilimonas cestriensis]